MSEQLTSTRHASGLREGPVLMLASGLTIVGSVMVAPILPKLGAHFGPAEPAAELLVPLAVTGPALAIALFAPIAGLLADRIGRKNLLVLGTLFYALLGIVPAFLNDLTAIVGFRLLFGCAEAAIMTCCAALIADYWSGNDRMRYVNLQVITIGLMGSIFFVVGGALGEHSWRTPFYLYLLPILLVPFLMKILWEPSRQREVTSAEGRQETVRAGALIIGYVLICYGMVLNFVIPVQTPALLVEMGITSSTMIGLSTGMGLACTLLGSLLWPVARGSLGIRGCNALLLALLALGLWLLSRADSYEAVLIAVFVHGIGAGLLVPNVMAPVMNALTSRTRGRGMGGFTSCLYIGQFVSPLVITFLAVYFGDLRSTIAGLAFITVFGSVLWLLSALMPSRVDQSAIEETP